MAGRKVMGSRRPAPRRDEGPYIPGIAWSKADVRIAGLEEVVIQRPVRILRLPGGRIRFGRDLGPLPPRVLWDLALTHPAL